MCTRTLKNTSKINETDLAYAAAFIDGEGYIEYTRRPKKNRYNTDHDIIRWLRNTFDQGYLVHIKPRRVKNGMSQPQLRWQLTHNKVHNVLKQIFPYMKEKAKIERAKKIFKYYE